MTPRQRLATAVGAAIGLLLGHLFFGDGRSVAATAALAVLVAIVGAAIGWAAARTPQRRD